jgi:hypothetical protein
MRRAPAVVVALGLLLMALSSAARSEEIPDGLSPSDYIASLLIADFLHHWTLGTRTEVACIANCIGRGEGKCGDPSPALLRVLAAKFEATHRAYIRPISACDAGEENIHVQEISTGRDGVFLILHDYVDVTTPILEKELGIDIPPQDCGPYELYWHAAGLSGGSSTYRVHENVMPWQIEELGCGITE